MMKRITALALLWGLFVSTLYAGPVKLEEVPAKAKWIVHIDTEQALKGKAGEVVKLITDRPEVSSKLAALKVITSVNLMKDIYGITICGEGNPDKTGVVMVNGKFDPTKLTTILKASDTYTEKSYGKHMLLSWSEMKNGTQKNNYACFARDDLAILGPNTDVIKHTLDVLDGKEKNFLSQNTTTGIEESKNAFIMVAAANGLNELEGINPQAAVLKKIVNAYLSFEESDSDLLGTLKLEAENEETVINIKQMILGVQGMAMITAEQKPELAKIAQTIAVDSKGSNLTASIACPFEMIKKVIEREIQKKLNYQKAMNAETAAPAKAENF
ncbi:MAG: hypothetical protein JXR97_11660 [Planctomycetes bacterium]|nr:hypothetical protein [Planctomycetota bacterium]